MDWGLPSSSLGLRIQCGRRLTRHKGFEVLTQLFLVAATHSLAVSNFLYSKNSLHDKGKINKNLLSVMLIH